MILFCCVSMSFSVFSSLYVFEYDSCASAVRCFAIPAAVVVSCHELYVDDVSSYAR